MTDRTLRGRADSPWTTSSQVTTADRFDHLLARLGYRRMEHRVAPGLYALGTPSSDSPVLVTSNYTLSFDALRSALSGRDAYILVLDTRGVNVWCAAGEGTFGTEELVRRIAAVNLASRTRTRSLILPQLGAPGVSADEVKRLSEFAVEYGPVRASDVGEYLRTRRVSPAMRRVRFGLGERLAVAMVDVVKALLPTALVAAALYFIAGSTTAWAVVAAALSGVLLFPLLLPWLPTRAFTIKGLLLGGVVALPFAFISWAHGAGSPLWTRLIGAMAYVLAMPPLTAFLALMFTGSTTFTSRTQVRREIFAYIPLLAWLFGAGLALTFVVAGLRIFGGAA
jgi:CO dehydrogenase/acetyl-CoA synthase delta subunit